MHNSFTGDCIYDAGGQPRYADDSLYTKHLDRSAIRAISIIINAVPHINLWSVKINPTRASFGIWIAFTERTGNSENFL